MLRRPILFFLDWPLVCRPNREQSKVDSYEKRLRPILSRRKQKQNSRDRRDKVQTKARSGYLGNALFQDLLVDVKETGSEVVLLDSAREGKTIFQAIQDPAGCESHPYFWILSGS